MSWWAAILRQQQEAGFVDLAGAEAWVSLPISDRLISEMVTARLPGHAPVTAVSVIADGDNQFQVKARLAAASFLPALSLRLAITRQPQLPDTPVLVLQIASQGLGLLAAPLARAFARLPPWVRMDGDRIAVDLQALAAQFGTQPMLRYLTDIELTTVPGRFIVRARGRLDDQVSGTAGPPERGR